MKKPYKIRTKLLFVTQLTLNKEEREYEKMWRDKLRQITNEMRNGIDPPGM